MAGSVPMRDWSAELLDSMQGICELLDGSHPQRPYVSALREQRLKLEDVEHTPSARLLRELRDSGESFRRWRCAIRATTSSIACKSCRPAPERVREFEAEVQQSLRGIRRHRGGAARQL